MNSLKTLREGGGIEKWDRKVGVFLKLLGLQEGEEV